MNAADQRNTESFEDLLAGDHHYKAYVGPPKKYDLVGAMQFNLLTAVGLRDHHQLLDIGCGSLRAGKLIIPYLRKGNYFGIEPNKWLVEDGIQYEVGASMIELKSPHFDYSADFELSVFEEKFDFIVAQSIFSHAYPAQIEKCLDEAKKVLKADGYFLATFILGSADYTGQEWVYPGCVEYTKNYIDQRCEERGLKAIQLEWLHPNGQTWYAIVHRSFSTEAGRNLQQLFEKNRTKRGFMKRFMNLFR